ncbi:MAG: invasin domain 3-containing protein, partial [Candidatus Poribacteria bacterium]|nr:invasin domain 3-containing protein [Candidatus Poribacteria bacterium]
AVEKETLIANGVSTTLITIELLDQHSLPVADETVELVTDLGTITATAKNLDNGTYAATYTASRKSGTATITAVTGTTGVSGVVSISLQPQQVSSKKSTAVLDRKWATIGLDKAVLTIEVLDAEGLPMDGQAVSVSLQPATDITLGQIKETNQTGQTQVEISSQTKGPRTITIQVGETVLDAKPVITFTSDQVTQATIQAGGRRKAGQLVKVPIILSNEVGQPISGKLATLMVEPELGVTVTQPSQASDTEGKLEATLLAETVGVKTLKVKVGETVFPKTASLILEAGPVESVDLQSEQTSLLPEESAKLTIMVSDKYLNPIKGVPVELESTLGQVSKARDEEDGTYQATFTAPSQTGEAILSATVQDKMATLVLTVTDQPALTISPMTTEVEQGQTLQFEASEPVLWIVKGGIGTIDSESGLFTATKIGTGTVTAWLEENPTVKTNSGTITVIKAKLPATALVFDLPQQVEFGTELGLKGQLIVVDQPDNIASDQPIVITFTDPQQKSLKFAPRTDNQGRYALDTGVKFNQVGVWQLSLNYAGSSQWAASQRQLTINASKARGSIKFLSAESAELDYNYLLVGALQPEVDRAEMEVQILGPDTRLIELSLITDAAGGFKHQFKLELDGPWSATVTWPGDDNHQAVTETFQLNVVKRFGKVIIGLGGTGTEETIAWPRVKSTAEQVYKTFKARRFNPKEDIYFLSSEPSLTEGAQAETTLKTLEFAITNWAGQEVNKNVPLYIYLLSHGLGQNFLVKQEGLQEDYLTPGLLDLWLDKLPPDTPVTVIIEACYSGSFIGAPLSGPNRTIITSAGADKQAMIGRRSSFTSFFFSEIEKNHTIAEAFEKSKSQMARNSMFFDQSPQIEVNNNGKESEILNLRALKGRRIPADISSRSLRPVFRQQVPPVVLKAGENSHRLRVEIGRMIGSGEEEVTAEIIQPDFDPSRQFLDWKEIEEQIPVVELERIKAEEGSSQYQLEYQGFDQVGEYTIVFQAKNVDGYAEPIQTTVTVPVKGTQPLAQLTGDINGDKIVDIFDLVLVASQFGQDGDNLMGDPNGDKLVDIFDLVIVAGNF